MSKQLLQARFCSWQGWRSLLNGATVCVLTAISFSATPSSAQLPTGNQGRVAPTTDEASAAVGELSAAIRDTLDDGPAFELHPESGWSNNVAGADSVILVPGLFAGESSMDLIRQSLAKQGIPVATFRYANQLPIDTAANGLANALAELQASEPTRQIAIVTHSLGGIVARAALEPDHRSSYQVKRLIMVGPPNHGSALAAYSANDLSQYIASLGGEYVDLGVLNSAASGFIGDAKESLAPGSNYLNKLNACPRAADVEYTIIAGNDGPIRRETIELPLALTELILGTNGETKRALAPVEKFMSTDDWMKGFGDGAVSIKSARLPGVDDFVVLPFCHTEFGGADSDSTTLRDQTLNQSPKAAKKRQTAKLLMDTITSRLQTATDL